MRDSSHFSVFFQWWSNILWQYFWSLDVKYWMRILKCCYIAIESCKYFKGCNSFFRPLSRDDSCVKEILRMQLVFLWGSVISSMNGSRWTLQFHISSYLRHIYFFRIWKVYGTASILASTSIFDLDKKAQLKI